MRCSRKRFENKFIREPNSGCWLWTAGINSEGYGKFSIGDHDLLAHRAAWKFFRGPIPIGKCVLHHCDIRSCVNPDHLFLGSFKDNTQDALRKGRLADQRGLLNCHAKLTEAQVKEIRIIKGSLREIAARFGINHRHVLDIRKRKLWRHLP